MNIKLGPRFSEQQIDEFVNSIYSNYLRNPFDEYHFDLSEIEWISNSGLLLITGLLKYFVANDITFELTFLSEGVSTLDLPRRVAVQIVEIWETWNLYKVAPNADFKKYFGIDKDSIESLKRVHSINLTKPKIYDRFGITPFVCLEKIANYKDRDIDEILHKYHTLNEATMEIITNYGCQHPFINNVLGSIISKEIYENFLDHFENSIFQSKEDWAFLTLALKGKLEEQTYSKAKIQNRLAENFILEEIPSTKDFFYNDKTSSFVNHSLIQYSFLDFGKGIVETLREEYDLAHPNPSTQVDIENDILKYAFSPKSSRHPIILQQEMIDGAIPRGLFDVLCIVKRFRGLLIVRSNFGKITYDFWTNKDFESAFSTFGDKNQYFPGTLITIYLPALPFGTDIDTSALKPIITKPSYKSDTKKYLNLRQIINNINNRKSDLYSNLIREVHRCFNCPPATITYLSFRQSELDLRLTKKLIYFLLTNYDFNINNNIIVLYPPKIELLREISQELLSLSLTDKNFKIHPLPFIYFDFESENLMLYWLGIYDEHDRAKLNEDLFEFHSLIKSDFNEPYNLVGQINFFDEHGNLNSKLPNRQEIIDYYRSEYKASDFDTVNKFFEKANCLKHEDPNFLYLNNGNYYQYEFLELIDILNDIENCDLLSNILYDKILQKRDAQKKYKFIGITSSSHKILDSFSRQFNISEKDFIRIDNYHSFELDDRIAHPEIGFGYILICDVISTGILSTKIDKALTEKGCTLDLIAVFANSIDPEFSTSKEFLLNFAERLISLFNHPIPKYFRDHAKITADLQTRMVIRVDPFTNIPIRESINKVHYDNVLLKNSDFLKYISEDDIFIGYLAYNNVIHPYFFNTDIIIKKLDNLLIKEIFASIKLKGENLKIFYPKYSAIKFFDFDYLINSIFKDQSIEIYKLERFNTIEGWIFPNSIKHLKWKIEGFNVLILDDGSCTGDSLIQMINEVSLFSPKNIVVLSFVGRINDRKGEFLSIVNKVRVPHVTVQVFFASHWHIPTYYLDENPNILERNWLQNIISIQNTPNAIKRIASSIMKALEPKSMQNFKDYSFLPRYRSNPKLIPKKEIILVRNEVGKITGYKFFTESFEFFDHLIRKYEVKKKSPERFKEIELLCSVIVYEPYLFVRIKQICPDVIDKMMEFIDAIIFGNPKQGNRKINIEEDLTYKWSKRDFVHLFFIVFRNSDLFEKLKFRQNFEVLIQFLGDQGHSVYYVLYKLLGYFPLNANEILFKQNSEQIKELIYQLSETSEQHKMELKRFYYFLTTLPTRDTFKNQLLRLRDNYTEQRSKLLHDKKETFNHNVTKLIGILRTCIEELKQNIVPTEDTMKIIQFCWHKMSEFMNPIISFSKKYPEYLKPYPYYHFVNMTDSVMRGKLSYIEENFFIYNTNSLSEEKLSLILQSIVQIQASIEVDSDFNMLIETPTINFYSFYIDLCRELNKLTNKWIVEKPIEIDKAIEIWIPKFYTDRLIIDELITNLKNNADLASANCIILKLQRKGSIYELEIENRIKKDIINAGSGEGIRCLKEMSDSSFFDFTYVCRKVNENTFHQLFTFKSNQNGF